MRCAAWFFRIDYDELHRVTKGGQVEEGADEQPRVQHITLNRDTADGYLPGRNLARNIGMVTQSLELGTNDSRWVKFSCGKLCYYQNVETAEFSLEEPLPGTIGYDDTGGLLHVTGHLDHDKKNFRQRLTQARRAAEQAQLSSGEYVCETTGAAPAGRNATLPSRFEPTRNKNSQVFLASLRTEEARKQRLADIAAAQAGQAGETAAQSRGGTTERADSEGAQGQSPAQQLLRVACLPCRFLYCVCILPTKCMPDCAPSQINLDGTLNDAAADEV